MDFTIRTKYWPSEWIYCQCNTCTHKVLTQSKDLPSMQYKYSQSIDPVNGLTVNAILPKYWLSERKYRHAILAKYWPSKRIYRQCNTRKVFTQRTDLPSMQYSKSIDQVSRFTSMQYFQSIDPVIPSMQVLQSIDPVMNLPSRTDIVNKFTVHGIPM